MKPLLRVLHVEDCEQDEALVVLALRRGGYELIYQRVETQPALKAALKATKWDLVISDYSLPQYNGLAALADVRESEHDLPFILVSGTIGETRAVEVMRAGANDYLLKDRLARLCVAVEREVREARARVEQRKVEEHLVISERMASAGTLAAGVAHEINNPLAVVMANLDFISHILERMIHEARALGENGSPAGGVRELLQQLEGVDEPLRDSREAAKRIRSIVRDVKLFSRPEDDQKGAVDLHRVIESSLRMAWNEVRHRARVVKEYGDIPMVDGHEARLGQVMLNLIINAAQAIPEGSATSNEIRLTTQYIKDGPIIVEVRDTGPGIAQDNLERIFDPFFTTKPFGVGTGLGLSICRRILAQMGGEIAAESEPGQWTVMRVTLPVAQHQPTKVLSRRAPTTLTRRARILVIDDEPAIGSMLARALQPMNSVTSLTSGSEALALFAAGERFDAIVADLMMPDVTGMALHAELARLDAGQAARMIFLTGGAFTAKASEFLDRVPNPRMEKPFDMADLLFAIAGLL